jgi:beta-galactosidase/beta-glucuronidase
MSTDADELLERVELATVDASPVVARLTARLPGVASEELTLGGFVYGPLCDRTQTLPARCPFVAKQNAPGELLAEAIVPDPCFWSAQLPMVYRLRLELRAAGELAASRELLFKLRQHAG